MKKIFSIIILSLIIMLTIVTQVQARNSTNQLRLKVTKATEDYEIYILLPKNYIEYAIQYDGLDLQYEGANTLKYNIIPSIIVNMDNVQEKTYTHEGTEYVQIKLDNLGEEEYLFEIISEYTTMDMMYRVKSASRDNIMIINNFTFEDNVCEMEYNYQENQISTEGKTQIKLRFNLEWWQFLAIIIIVITIVYVSNRRSSL